MDSPSLHFGYLKLLSIPTPNRDSDLISFSSLIPFSSLTFFRSLSAIFQITHSQHSQRIMPATNPPANIDSNTLFFWQAGHQETGFLSQWYPEFFVDSEGHRFRYAETYMMYQKALLFGDTKVAKEILECTSPRQVKDLGRQVHGFDEKKWKKYRESIVYKANLLKFEQNKHLRSLLLATGERRLVEASPFDKVWGIGFTEDQAERNRDRWGSNLLGKQLMKVRKKLGEGQ
jgi:ribA/ribD-fused uncharacterized protein